MASVLEHKKLFVILISIILLTDLAILLNIPFLRQVCGFLFLTILPGILILHILKLNKIGFTEKFVLSVGLSISFLLLFGLLINNLSLSLGYETPLSTIPLLISFNIVFILLAIIGYNGNKNSISSPPYHNLSTYEKAFLIVPVLFPALSILGMYVMNTTDNNIIVLFLLFSIPIYVAFVCFFNRNFSKRLYPVVIFLISLSLLLLLSLRSNHIMGSDVHVEYHLFQITLNNLHWRIAGFSTLDACLSISLLPTIYQSILNTNPEFLYKILYPLLYSISPLVVYIIAKKYIGELYGFLTACFFMFQFNFLWTTANPRTNLAILFVALVMLALFNDKIAPIKKRILVIVFMASCMVSHYSTTYIFLFLLVGTFILIEIFTKRYRFKSTISLTIVILFFSLIFFWYSQVTGAAFYAGVGFIEDTVISFNTMFLEESRSTAVQELLGEKLVCEEMAYHIKFFTTWMSFAFIFIGIITLTIRYKEMSFPELNYKKADFIKEKFEVEYFIIALVCVGMLMIIIAAPYITKGYDTTRPYAIAIVIISVFFVIGGITISKILSFVKKKYLEKFDQTDSQNPFVKSGDKEKGSEVLAYIIILLVLIPYFFCVTTVVNTMFGGSGSVMLNSEGREYDLMYIHDQDSYGAKWLKAYYVGWTKIYTDTNHRYLHSQGKISSDWVRFLSPKETVEGYVLLGYHNIAHGKLGGREGITYNMTAYSDIFIRKNKLYNNGGFEIWN